MRVFRGITWAIVGAIWLGIVSGTTGQIVINKVVKEQRDGLNDGASVNPDVREFIELYNAGNSAVDLGGWRVNQINLVNGASDLSDTISSGMLGPGEYFVIGSAGVPSVDFTPIDGEIFTDIAARVLELRNSAGALQDAVAYDVWRTGTTRLTMATAEQLAQIGSGFQGELFSLDEGAQHSGFVEPVSRRPRYKQERVGFRFFAAHPWCVEQFAGRPGSYRPRCQRSTCRPRPFPVSCVIRIAPRDQPHVRRCE